MRAIALALVATFALSATAEAQSRGPLRATVKQRSFLDAGKADVGGRTQNYARSGQYYERPIYHNNSVLFGSSLLPSRIGGGVNPFCCF